MGTTLNHDRLVDYILSNNRTNILLFSCAYLKCDKEGSHWPYLCRYLDAFWLAHHIFCCDYQISYRIHCLVPVIRVQKICLFCLICFKTRQIWRIWKLRPAYSFETPNLGQNLWCFVPCDLEIWWMTLENHRASLLCCFKLCATFHSHWWIETGVTVGKHPIWVKFDDF